MKMILEELMKRFKENHLQITKKKRKRKKLLSSAGRGKFLS
jgi:hypothetical protein